MFKLMPRETQFNDMFAEMSANIIQGATLLKEVFADFTDVPVRIQQLKTIEHRGDELTHAILIKLNQTFITPFDREGIHALAASLDDVLDFIYAAGLRLVTYKIQSPPRAASLLAEIIIKQAEQIAKAVKNLEDHEHVLACCVEINFLENEADRVTQEAMAELFETETNPINLIKIKELLETLEISTDKAEDVANSLESVILKSR